MAKEEQYSEQELLRNTAQGDRAAFTALYEQYRHKLYGFLLQLTRSREMTADVVQDVFLKLWEDRAKLADVERFDTYFHSMVRNRSLNLLRRIALEADIISELTSREGDSRYDTDPVLYQELRRKLEELIVLLPEQQQRVYRLSREQGMKQEAIAALLGISLPTVKTHLSRATQFLRKNMLSGLLLSAYFGS